MNHSEDNNDNDNDNDNNDKNNKAVYTTASVAYRWAMAVMEVKSPFGVWGFTLHDGWTNRPTK